MGTHGGEAGRDEEGKGMRGGMMAAGGRKGKRAQQERNLVAADVRRQVSRGLVKVLALHADQDKEISRGVNMDNMQWDGGGKKEHLRENTVHT